MGDRRARDADKLRSFSGMFFGAIELHSRIFLLNRPEAAIQRKIAGRLSWALPDDAFYTAVAHGRRLDDKDARARLRGMQAKQEGTKSGVPDMLILWRGRAYFGEVKSPVGSLTGAQRYTIPLVERAGCPVAVWRSLDDALASIQEWGIPLRTLKPSIERIRRGFRLVPEGAEWPESVDLGRCRRKTP
jgi:VRR-NUC domain-containing protein